jgi:fatty acid desaturase
LAPWLARVRDEIDRSSGLRRLYYLHLQWLVLPILIGLNAFNMAKTGWRYLLRALFDRHRRTRKHWLDLCALVLHFTLLVALPSVIYGARPVLTLYLLRMVLLGYLMFAILAPGHFPAEAICLSREANRSDYVLLQTAATVNFRVGWVGKLLCSGLQYQIEHHLFPGISHVHYPEVSILMRDFCRNHRLPYRSYQWDHALYKCLATFRYPPAVTTLEEFLASGVMRPGAMIAAKPENSGSE